MVGGLSQLNYINMFHVQSLKPSFPPTTTHQTRNTHTHRHTHTSLTPQRHGRSVVPPSPCHPSNVTHFQKTHSQTHAHTHTHTNMLCIHISFLSIIADAMNNTSFIILLQVICNTWNRMQYAVYLHAPLTHSRSWAEAVTWHDVMSLETHATITHKAAGLKGEGVEIHQVLHYHSS